MANSDESKSVRWQWVGIASVGALAFVLWATQERHWQAIEKLDIKVERISDKVETILIDQQAVKDSLLIYNATQQREKDRELKRNDEKDY